ncbi:3-carboxy-cis-cis-mucoante lactonizing enzyme [Apiospora marii]|uniref:3-carboxy-cis-cis-mucoante lactonizing enzyme n=1 Tax=Apiospora marii TaxID=335849 RepID=A0ABR1R1X1_9PEZI
MPMNRKPDHGRPQRRWLRRLAAAAAAAMAMATTAHARPHHLFAASLGQPPRLYSLVFDDATGAAAVAARLPADAAHARIALDAGRVNVYGVSLDKAAVASYEVVVANSTNATTNGNKEGGGGGVETTTNVTLAFRTSVAAAGACLNRTAAFVLPHPRFGRVYAASWPGPGACAMALSTTGAADGDGKGGGGGVLEEVVQSWRYDEKYVSGGIAGLALDDPAGLTIYSADLEGEALWAHSVSPDGTGRVVGLRGRFDLLSPPEDRDRRQRKRGVEGPSPLSPPQGPRRLVVHPNGRVLYVVLAAANAVAAYSLDEATRLPLAEISRHSLLPSEGADPAAYRGAEVVLSMPSSSSSSEGDEEAMMPKYLWAAAAAATEKEEGDPQAGGGFITVFGLKGETGEIRERPLARVATGARTNAIAPAPWSEDWAAVADVGTGFVEMWRIEGGESDDDNTTTTAATARSVARVDMPGEGCCGNVIWYD